MFSTPLDIRFLESRMSAFSALLTEDVYHYYHYFDTVACESLLIIKELRIDGIHAAVCKSFQDIDLLMKEKKTYHRWPDFTKAD